MIWNKFVTLGVKGVILFIRNIVERGLNTMKSFRWSHFFSYLFMVLVLIFFLFVFYQVVMLGIQSVTNGFFINFGRH